MSKSLLGQILASVALGALDAGEILLDPSGTAKNPGEITQVIEGFFAIWTRHPANQKGA